MELKLLSLNISRYYQDWESRKPKIIAFIEENNPDVVVLQECFDDSRYNKKADNQGVQLNRALLFKNCIYSVAEKLKSEAGKPIDVPVYDGLCILTNLPVILHEDIKLKQTKDDKHTRIIQKVVLSKGTEQFTIFHTHFSNRDDWAKAHFKETMGLAKEEPVLPIILGDLNMRIQEDVLEIGVEDYEISWFVKKYDSYPSKEETLDYVLVPKNHFKFDDVSCLGRGLYDHKALITKISTVKDVAENEL